MIAGWAWDGTNTPISVDIYDNGVLLTSPLANLFRQDLLNAGIGNGYHAFNIATPTSLKDGQSHYITIFFHGTSNALLGSGTGTTIACPSGSPGYQYYDTDALTSINANSWTQNGVGSAGTSGYTSSDANGGSLISKIAVPDGTSLYEVKTTLALVASGGTYTTYLHGTSNALAANGNTGTFYAIQIANPTFSSGGVTCVATLTVSKSVSGTVTTLSSASIPCHNGMTVRAVAGHYSWLAILIDNRLSAFLNDTAIAAGMPGIGVSGAPAGNTIAKAELGPINNVAPSAVISTSIATSVFANRVDMRWQGVADGPSGPGIAYYSVLRNGTLIGNAASTAAFTDSTVSPSTTYSYTLTPVDQHVNVAQATTFSVVTPPAGSVDPRQVGVRPTGTYWGAAGEQIDLRSGNLNFRLPLVKAAGRGGSGLALGLSYNSANWRQDAAGVWQLGTDVGYGYGWKLQVGSLLPVYQGVLTVDHYLFTDSSGAEYRMDQNTNGVWTSKEGIYASYDSNSQRLYFPDGTFWVFGAVSAGTEEDAGTMYPTQFEDTNGNQILLRYGAATGLPWTGSSARIVQVEDVRAGGTPPSTYNFNYNADAIPHLTSIANTIGTAENYIFTPASQTLTSPFNSTSYGPWTTLASVKQAVTNQTTSFQYNASGELTQMTTPFGGSLSWTHGNATYTGSVTQRQVQSRSLVTGVGAQASSYTITGTPGASATVNDASGHSQKIWNFQTNTSLFNFGMVTSYDQQQMPGQTTLAHNDFTWVQDSAGNPYVGTTITTLDPAQPYAISKKTTQTLDSHGNATQMKFWDFYTGTPPTNPKRTYTNTYLTDNGACTYSNLYIFNRLLSSTLTDGANSTTLVTNQYASSFPADAPGIREHDSNYNTSYLCRGNLTSSTTPSGTVTINYDIAGNIAQRYVNGELTTNTVSNSTNYAVPSAMTTINLTSSVNYTSFLAPSSATGPNGDSASINYDTLARLYSSISPYGATTTYQYSDPNPPTSGNLPWRQTKTNGHWVKTTLDGFGRAIKTETGDDTNGTSSIVDTDYAACGCTPIGKMYRTSMPHAPNATVYWKTYAYDGLGRTIAATEPDNTSITNYSYGANTSQVTDPAGKWKNFTMDAFGNLTSVREPDPLDFAILIWSTSRF